MPTDWLFYWMILPTGLAVITVAVVLPFFIWRLVLSSSFASVGFVPLAAAYVLAAVGLLTANFISSHLEFSARVAQNLLPEAQRWTTVTGWAIYVSVLSLLLVLPLLGLVAVPAAAWLLKLRRMSLKTIAVGVLGVWLSLALIAWALPSNEWHRTHRLESLGTWLTALAPPVALVGFPFLLGIHIAARRYRNAEAQPLTGTPPQRHEADQ